MLAELGFELFDHTGARYRYDFFVSIILLIQSIPLFYRLNVGQPKYYSAN